MPRSLPTLKGVFPNPKIPPRRDFIKENKLKLDVTRTHVALQNPYFESEACSSKKLLEKRTVPPRSALTKRNSSSCSCGSKYIQVAAIDEKQMRLRKTNCDKGVQTDDIFDEIYLAAALKRCSAKDEPNKIDFSNNLTGRLNNFESENFPEDNSEADRFSSVGAGKDISAIGDKNNKTVNSELISNGLNINTPSLIKIPHYNRRGEEFCKQVAEMEKDSNCPEGYQGVSDEDRQTALKTAETRFKELVDELNRMPMSSETLRVRNRKVEIEKALIALENTIRTFSKSKVYVKESN